MHQEGIVCLAGEKNQLISHSFCFLSKLDLDIGTWDWLPEWILEAKRWLGLGMSMGLQWFGMCICTGWLLVLTSTLDIKSSFFFLPFLVFRKKFGYC